MSRLPFSQLPHLDPVLLQALDSYDLPDPKPVRQAGFTSLDIQRACRQLEELFGQQVGAERSIDDYNQGVKRWRRNRDYLCRHYKGPLPVPLRDGTRCRGRIRAILLGMWTLVAGVLRGAGTRK